ncbi:hypothetical protein LOZ65_002314 [Ophidiomyces ophidiicola]|nr:hypothetical protein LOZ65_002314 [Ophidiomyces ophidiicola]
MSAFKGFVKDGWHPTGRDGGRESWRGDFKGINQVAGWVGKGKDSGGAGPRNEHIARPVSTLRDPSSFAPPPRRVNTTPNGVAFAAPHAQIQETVPSRSPPPPVPSRANSTNPSTNYSAPQSKSPVADSYNNCLNAKPKPSLPPRLPPRGDSTTSPSPPPPPYEATHVQTESYLNQAPMGRLASVGVSVPALGIQRLSSTAPGSRAQSQSQSGSNAANELQARFSQLNTSSPDTSSFQGAKTSPNQGFGSQQPLNASPVALPIASQTATQNTVNNQTSAESRPNLPASMNSFRERHGDQIQSVKGKLNGLNQKYGITKRINEFIEDQKSPANPNSAAAAPPPGQATPNHPYPSPNASRPDLDALNKRKPPPPPPPPKKPSMQSNPISNSPSPPPLPLNTKPR